MNRVIRNPYWTSAEKKQVMVEFHYSDGRVLNAAVTNTPDSEPNNPDWDEVLEHFSLEEIDANTANIDPRRVAANSNAMQQQQRPLTIEELRQAPPNETDEARRDRHNKLTRALEEEKQAADRAAAEALFQAKLDAFNIEAVKDSTNRKIKSKIRKSKTHFEINAYVSYLILESELREAFNVPTADESTE